MMNETKKIKVLHIDDDEAFLKLFRKTYEDEFDIVSIPGGEDVPEIVGRETPDALVLDYELPGRNGLELLSAIREKHPSLPVVFCTGQGNEEVARQAFKDGATDYFVKRTADFAQKEKLVNSVRKAVERRAVEEELAEQRAMLEGIIELNPYSINIMDTNGRHVRVNRAFLELWGNIPPPDIDQMRIIENYDDNYKDLNNRLRNGESLKYPPVWMKPEDFQDQLSGNKVCVGARGFSIKNQTQKPKYYVIMHEDITARVEAEEALKKAHEDLTIAHEELRKAYESTEQKVTERTAELADANTKLACTNNRLAETNSQLADANSKLQAEIDERVRLQGQLERQNRELEGFSHTVSHDLRNNLIVMQRLMERGNMAQDDRQKTQKLLLNNTAHLQQFVERLLFLAQAGKTIAEKRKVSLDEAARKAFSMAAASHADAELSVTSPFPPVLCDPQAFEQIFSNLFSNSLIYSATGVKPVIHVGCAMKDSTAEITVQDNGKGIDPAVLPKVFDSTFTTDRREHFGLGLAIVKKLVEAHGGTVRAESEGPGRGAAFIISLFLDA
ncbi:MAG: ATP-binding protein [Candidatus Xenobiia bacterium LiM19]